MSGGFFRGTSADQDTRFSNKQAKLLKSQKFAPELETPVNMKKVNLDVMRPWIATRVTELLGFEDEVLINFIYGLLEVDEVDGKKIQIQLTGFMEKNTVKFMKELWGLLLSAQNNVSGVPQQFLDSKEEEMRKKKAETDRITQEIQRRKEKERDDLEREKHDRMGIEIDASRNGAAPPDPVTRNSLPQYDDENMDDQRKWSSRTKDRDGVKSRSSSVSSEFRRQSTSPRKGHRASPKQMLDSPERHHNYPSRSKLFPRRKRSISPYHRHSSPSAFKRSSPITRRRRSRSRSGRRFSPTRQRSHYRWRSPSPMKRRSPSPLRRRSRSPVGRQSPYLRRSSSSPYRRFPSPLHDRSCTPPRRRSPPSHRRDKSPSPIHRRDRSPSPIHRQNRSSPIHRRNRSPSPSHRRNRSPSPIHRRNRSPSPIHRRNRSPSPIQRRNRVPSPIQRRNRSPSPIHRRNRSPPPIHRRLHVHRRSPASLRHESPCKRRSQSPPKRNSSIPLSRSPAHRPPEDRTPSASPRHATEITLKEQRRNQIMERSSSPSLRSNRSSSREADNHNNSFQARRHRDDMMSERTHVKLSPDQRSTKITEPHRLQSSLGSPQPHSRSQRDTLSRITRERSSNDHFHDNKLKKQSLSRSPGTWKINRISHSSGPETDEEETIYARETMQHRTNNLHKKGNQFSIDGIGKKLADKKRSPEMYSSGRSPAATLSPVRKVYLHKHKSERREHELSSDVHLLGKHGRLSPSEEREYGPGTIWEESPSMHKSYERHGSKDIVANSSIPLDEKHSSEVVGIICRDARPLSGDDGHRETIFVEYAEDLKEKVDKKYQWNDVETGCKEGDADRFHKKKRKHKRHKKIDSDDDHEHVSEMDDRRDAKRKRKDEKRQNREERHRRREERHLRRLERRSGRLETESVDTVTPYLDKQNDNADGSGGSNKMMCMGSYLSDSEETESEQKKLEIELRKKALESLRAKKAINP